MFIDSNRVPRRENLISRIQTRLEVLLFSVNFLLLAYLAFSLYVPCGDSKALFPDATKYQHLVITESKTNGCYLNMALSKTGCKYY